MSTDTNSLNQNTIEVSTSEELEAALSSATGGETILLAAGDYGDVRIVYQDYPSTVTIKSAAGLDSAFFDSIVVKESSNLTFDSINVNLVPTEEMVSWERAVNIVNSSDITILNSDIKGGPAISGSTQDTLPGDHDPSGNIIGLSTGYGVYAHSSERITIEGTEISEFAKGIILLDVDGVNVINNELHHMRASPVMGQSVSNVVVDGNYIHTSNPWQFGGPGDHGDYIHFSTKYGEHAENFTITNNVIAQNDGYPILGIVLDGGGENDPGISNVEISNNVIINSNLQGITLHRVDGATVSNNTLVQTGDDAKFGPTVMLTDNATNITIEDNILSNEIGLNISDASADTLTANNNYQVQSDSPDEENYIGNLYTDPLGGSGGLDGFQVVPGSAVDVNTVGSTLTQFDNAPATPTGYITSFAGSGLKLLDITFDASNLVGPAGALDLEGAEVSWDFGDGSSGNGLSPTHTYSQAGSYKAIATVTFQDGVSVDLHKTIKVQTPVAIQGLFDGWGDGQIADSTTAEIGEDVTFENGQDGQAVRLNGDTIEFPSSAELVGNSEYTLLFDFKMDEGALGDRDRIIHFDGSFSVDIEPGGLRIALHTDQGAQWLVVNNLEIDDAQWHRVAVTFSGNEGAAVLYIDGEEVARVEGLEGAVQTGNENSSFVVGDPWGGTFEGLIDNVGFIRGAIDASDAGSGLPAILDKLGQTSSSSEGATEIDTDDSTAEVEPEPAETPDPMDVIMGTDENNRLVGDDDGTQIEGLGGHDSIFGGDGNDNLDGGAGHDQIVAGAGDDSVLGGEGTDYLYGGEGADTISGDQGDDKLVGDAGADKLYGGAGADNLAGGGGNDLLDGGEDKDKLWAGDGDDTLIGGGSNDLLFGENGNDVLFGGTGNDYLVGGAGADEFVFEKHNGADRLGDFDTGEDKIILRGLEFASIDEVMDASFQSGSGLILHLDGPGATFSWATSNFVALVGIDRQDLQDGNISLVE